jgi:AraC-like DNA-binding protein
MSTVAIEPERSEPKNVHPIDLVANVARLLDFALSALGRDQEIARASLAQATTILRSELQRNDTTRLSDSGAGKLAPWQVLRVGIFIDNNLGRPIQVKDLSKIARRSASHFCRAFKMTFGQTPHSYITARRLACAKKLMLESEQSLIAIALDCGFTDQAHLSHLFRQHFSETPTAWRRRYTFNAALLKPSQALTPINQGGLARRPSHPWMGHISSTRIEEPRNGSSFITDGP